MIRQLKQMALRTGVLVVSLAPLSMARHRKVPCSEKPHRVRQLLVGFFAWGVIYAMGALSVRAASLNVDQFPHKVYQFTLGNPFSAGSATPYLQALEAALTGTLVSHTVFTPANVAVWGPEGQFGGELYFLSIVEGLPHGALLKEQKTVSFQFPGQSEEQTFFDVTFYFPMEAYDHKTSTVADADADADGFARLHFDPLNVPRLPGTEWSAVDSSATRTFASFASFAGDFSNGQGFAGTANTPPPAITFLTGTQVRYKAIYSVIVGTEGSDWTIQDPGISPLGYRFGTDANTNILKTARTFLLEPVERVVRVASTVGTTPPDCGLAHASPASLWPPNHALVSIAIGGVTDPDENQVTLTVTQVTQDEPVNGLGEGDTSPDAVLQAGGTVLHLRAERAGTGNGRVYHVTFMADDGSGGQCTGVVTVCAPHDQGKGNTCIDDGPQYNSLQP